MTFPLDDVKNDLFTVAAMVINKETGEIMNAKSVLVSKSGVDAVIDETDNAIRVENGFIITSYTNPIIYSLDGRCVNNGSLQSGIYIVVIDGEAKRILVK